MRWFIELLVAAAKGAAALGAMGVVIGWILSAVEAANFIPALGFVLLLEATGLMIPGGALDISSSGRGRSAMKQVRMVFGRTAAGENPLAPAAKRKESQVNAAKYSLAGVMLFVGAVVLVIIQSEDGRASGLPLSNRKLNSEEAQDDGDGQRSVCDHEEVRYADVKSCNLPAQRGLDALQFRLAEFCTSVLSAVCVEFLRLPSALLVWVLSEQRTLLTEAVSDVSTSPREPTFNATTLLNWLAVMFITGLPFLGAAGGMKARGREGEETVTDEMSALAPAGSSELNLIPVGNVVVAAVGGDGESHCCGVGKVSFLSSVPVVLWSSTA